MPAVSALSLSQIQDWDVTHLEDAAQRWSSTAQLWEDSYDSVHRGSLNPGETVWEGDAAEAAQQRTFADLVKVRGLADVLREASSAARWGAADILSAQRDALTAIGAAQAAGFTVGEDLSVSDPTPLASLLRGGRQTQAEELAAEIAARATALSALDHEVATKISTITAPLHETSFDETPTDNADNDIQALDRKQSPPHDDEKPTLEEILEQYQVSDDPDGIEEEWEPPWPLSIFTEPKRITAGEARMLAELNPLELRDMNQMKEAAEAEAAERFRTAHTGDNHLDAFRHAYWNALMTQRFGEDWTREFATAHERLPGNFASSEAMDLWNNEVGRRIAAANPNASPEQLADMVEQAVKNGETVVVRPDGQGVIWSDQIPVGGPTGNPSSSPPVAGQAPTPGPSPQPGGVYDPGQPRGLCHLRWILTRRERPQCPSSEAGCAWH